MKTIRNDSKRPISIPLPRGRKLHLGPGQTGEISDEAAEHPPLAALLEDGTAALGTAAHKPTGAAPPQQRPGAPGGTHQPGGRGGRRGDR